MKWREAEGEEQNLRKRGGEKKGVQTLVTPKVIGRGVDTKKKNTVEIAQLWQHNRGNYTTPTIFQKREAV